VLGELWIGGAGVAKGYLGRDDLTRDRFTTRRGERLYRTGDRVRRLPTGDLEFKGRLDQQVKVRGHRVELGEIESVLVRNQSVRQAAVALHDDALVAHVVINSSTPIDDAALAAHLAAELPEYMIPAAWVRHDELPLNANGKVDRAALPAPVRRDEVAGESAPRTEGEQKLAALWAEVLKKDGIGIHDNFFALGGHSLLAIRLLGRIAKTFGRRLTLRALFEHPTVASLTVILADDSAKETTV
jgi:acyl carrier protein